MAGLLGWKKQRALVMSQCRQVFITSHDLSFWRFSDAALLSALAAELEQDCLTGQVNCLNILGGLNA
jgi:hypothetical protein